MCFFALLNLSLVLIVYCFNFWISLKINSWKLVNKIYLHWQFEYFVNSNDMRILCSDMYRFIFRNNNNALLVGVKTKSRVSIVKHSHNIFNWIIICYTCISCITRNIISKPAYYQSQFFRIMYIYNPNVNHWIWCWEHTL